MPKKVSKKSTWVIRKERVKIIVKIIKTGVHDNYSINEVLEENFDWYHKVSDTSLRSYIKEAKNIVKTKTSTDYLLNNSFVFNELMEMYKNAQRINDTNMSLKLLQEMSKVQGLYDIDLKKQLFYKEELDKVKEVEIIEDLDDKRRKEKLKQVEEMDLDDLLQKEIPEF